MKKFNVSKKIVLGLFLVLLSVATSCEKESVVSNSNEQFDESTQLRHQGEVVVIGLPGGPSGRRGLAGPGIFIPGVTVAFNNCNNPNGICLYADVFGGHGEIDVWKAHLISNNTIRLEFLNPNDIDVPSLADYLQAEIANGNIWVNDANGQNSGENIDPNELASFISTHYNIPNAIPFEETISEKLFPKNGFRLHTVPGDYEIIVDDEHPNGYFDMSISIQPN